jgi:stage II sporulation protein D
VERELARLESKSGFRLRNEVTIRIYPSVELYRNASGLGGDIAAATRGREIRFQPLAILRRNGNLDGTVRHELAHALVLQEAKVPLPEWFHEALARWLSGGHARRGNVGEPCRALASFAELERLSVAGDFEARQDAASTADALLEAAVRRYGESTVLGWARMGLPREDDDTLRRLLREACQH